MARMDRLELGGTVAMLRRHLRNWYIAGPLSYLVMLSPLRHLLENSPLARACLNLRFRDGRVLRMPINDMQAYVEVFLLNDYQPPSDAWDGARVVVDVGANAGAASTWFAARFPQARVYAVEPAPASRGLLQHNLRANGLESRVTVVDAALGARAGTARISQAHASVMNRVSASGTGDEVRVLGMPELLGELGVETVDVLKLDCEGAEYDVLLDGADAWLGRVGLLLGEWHPSSAHDAEALERALTSAGFAVTMTPHPALPGFGNFTAVNGAPVSPGRTPAGR